MKSMLTIWSRAILWTLSRPRAITPMSTWVQARAAASLFLATRAWAAMEGRDFVLPDDVKALASIVLAHRLIVSPSARIKNVGAEQIVEDALRHTPVPGA